MNPAELWMVVMMPAVIGSMSRPEFAADSPELIWRNVGMKAIAENMPSPTAAPSAVATTKVRLRNRDRGITGSTARRSTSTNTTADATRAASSDSACQEPQPSRPPKSANRTRGVGGARGAAGPVPAGGVVPGWGARDSATQPMANTATPTGTLIQNAHSQP